MFMPVKCRTLTWATYKRPVVDAAVQLNADQKKWVPGTAGSCSTIDRSAVKPEKGQRFTLLKRITNYKSVNSESVGGSVLSHRVPSRGSCHLVDSTWVTHLNWNNFANSDELHRSRKRHQTKNLTHREFSGRWELAADAQYSCGGSTCPP